MLGIVACGLFPVIVGLWTKVVPVPAYAGVRIFEIAACAPAAAKNV